MNFSATKTQTFHSTSQLISKILLSLCLLSFVNIGLCFSQNMPALIKEGSNLLFVGNSKIGSEGGLHNHFRRTIAKANPPLTIQADWLSMYRMKTLSDMYTDDMVEKIKTGENDVVLVSNGSYEAMTKFAQLIKDSDKKMVLFGTWSDNPYLVENGLSEFRETTQRSIQEIKKIAKVHSVPVVPSGMIYYDLLVNPISFDGLRDDYLFVPGSSVQNDLGTLVNVSAIYAVTTGKSPVGLPMWDVFPTELVQAIQQRVWKIVQDWNSDNILLKPVPNTSKPKMKFPKLSQKPAKWPAFLEEGNQIFYVGNSYIGTEGGLNNHFTRLLSQINPSINIATTSQIFWGQGLGRMYTEGVRKEISTGKNDIVVVTSGPEDLLKKFQKDIEAAGSQMVVHMTWGRNPTINDGGMANYREQTSQIVKNMQTFEKETGVPVVPCGLIYYDLIVDPPNIDGLRIDWVFMVGNIHQNHIGTMINAAAHYAVMTGCSPVGLPMWDPYPPKLVKAIQKRAWKIVKDWKNGQINIKPIAD